MIAPKIGRCKNYSLPVAALIFFYEKLPQYVPDRDYIDYGELDWMHEIVDIAGGKQCSVWTAGQVSKALSQSPYWNHRFCPGYYGGMGNGGANLYTPSERGREKYEFLRA